MSGASPPSTAASARSRGDVEDRARTRGLATSAIERAGDLLDLAQRRSRALDGCLAADCAWNMMLHLVVSSAAGGRTTVSDACASSLLPHATAHRYLLLLERRGVVARRTDPADRRRQIVRLTRLGSDLMQSLLSPAG